MEQTLTGKRVLVTQATEFMGPVLCDVFAQQGAAVVASAEALLDSGAAERVVSNAGRIDVLVANLAFKAPSTPAQKSRKPSGDRCSPPSWILSRGCCVPLSPA